MLPAGNVLFTKGKYNAAADCYTEGITLDPTLAVLYVNRGMCYKKLGKWEQVAKDAATALSHSRDLMKAHYLLGVAQRELSNLQGSITHLSKALEAAREQGDSIKDEIWRELAKAKYAAWQQDSKQRSQQAEVLKQQFDALLKTQWMQGCVADVTGSATSCNGNKGSLEQQQQQVQEQLQSVLQVRPGHRPVAAASLICCRSGFVSAKSCFAFVATHNAIVQHAQRELSRGTAGILLLVCYLQPLLLC